MSEEPVPYLLIDDNDREFALVLYRALCMITAYLEKRYGFGKRK